MNKISFEEYFEKYDTLTYRNTGISMEPLLKQGRDVFTVEKKKNERFRKYDVVMYRRPPDKYVLHRIIKVRENDYVILGDNCINKETGITDEDILGVMTSFVRNGKEHKVTDLSYRMYVQLWCRMAFLRIFLKKVKYKLRKR